MGVTLKPLEDQVVVITGASSGIGLATALLAAEGGARVVLTARNEETLRETAEAIRGQGGEALGVGADVAERTAVEDVARQAIEAFGRIDTWVNNAGVSIYGRLDEVTEEDARRLFDTNFWGVVNGSLVALEHLREHGGALINVGSEVSEAVVPLQGMYSASKHAVKGFTDALRVEAQQLDDAPVSITLIQPTATQTPFPQHARNYMDREPKLPTPQIDPYDVAAAILECATKPKRTRKVGAMARLNAWTAKLAPALAERMEGAQASRQQYEERPRDPAGTLHRAGGEGRTHGVGGRTSSDGNESENGGSTMAGDIHDQLTKYLSDAHSIEEQSLQQMREVPDIAGEPGLASEFEKHLRETEGHENRIRTLLEDRDASPSRLKDTVMRAGGSGFVLFARSQPDTPGKLASHALSYEALEWASYDLLARTAERAGEPEVAEVAREIRDEERDMMRRLESLFDRTAAASLDGTGGATGDGGPAAQSGDGALSQEELRDKLGTYLADAHAIEAQSIQLLESGRKMVDTSPTLAKLFEEHLAESRRQQEIIEERLEAVGGHRSLLKDAAMRMGALDWGTFFLGHPDTAGKLAGFAYAFEHLEIGGYEHLRRVAERAGDEETVAAVDGILEQERATAGKLADAFDEAVGAALEEQGLA